MALKDMVNAGMQAATSMVDTAKNAIATAATPKQIGVPNAAAPTLSTSGKTPTLDPVSPDIKYGGNRVVGTSGQPNIGPNGYFGYDTPTTPAQSDPLNLEGIRSVNDPAEITKKINEDQTKNIAGADKPPVRPGYEVPDESKVGLAAPTTDPTQQYLDFLTKSFKNITEGTTGTQKFSATDTYNELYKNADIQTSQDSLNALNKDYDLILKNRQARIDAQQAAGDVPLGVVAGRVSEIEKQENTRLQEIDRERKVLLDTIQTKQDNIKTIMDLKKYDYETAREEYKNQFTQSMALMNAFRDVKKDQDATKSAAEKVKQDAIDKQRDDARANIQILYNNITDGGFDPMKMTKEEQVQWARQEMLAGLPAGTFYNLASTNPNQEIKSTHEYTDAQGNQMFDMILQDRSTGALTIKTVQGGRDEKSRLDLAKLQSEVNDIPLDRLIKKYNITEKEQQIAKNKADLANVPYDQMLKKIAVQKAQAELDKTNNETYETTGDYALGTTPTGIHHFGEQYGAGVEGNKSGRNQGTDISIPVGTPVAVPPGNWKVVSTVTGITGGDLKNYKSSGKVYGNSILLQNENGEKIRLSHLADVAVKNGDTVDGGIIVGRSGATGNVTGPHLDIEYYDKDGKLSDLRNSAFAGSYLGSGKKLKANAGSKPTEAEVQGDRLANMQAYITQLKKPVGDPFKSDPLQGDIMMNNDYMIPVRYKELRDRWKSQKGDVREFDRNFAEYVDPANKAAYGVSS